MEKSFFDEVGQITISLSVAQKNDNENGEAFLKRVDDLLYYAKNSGRNKVSY